MTITTGQALASLEPNAIWRITDDVIIWGETYYKEGDIIPAGKAIGDIYVIAQPAQAVPPDLTF